MSAVTRPNVSKRFVRLLVAGLLLALSSVGAQAAPERLTLGTATPGGGFELYGGVLAQVVNEAKPSFALEATATKGSRENIPLLEQGKLDIALVASLPAQEALAGIGRAEPSPLKIITAIYPTFGAFAVRGDSPARTFDDLIGQRVAWGTSASGLTLLGKYVTEGLGLDRDADFQAEYLEKAGLGAPMVLEGDVDALWGGGVGWPNFTKIMQGGGRLVGMTAEQTAKVSDAFAFLTPMTLPAGAYPGQAEPLETVASFSFVLARSDLPDETAYRLAKAIHQAQPALAARLAQGRETLPENTIKGAAAVEHIHPGVQQYLQELGLLPR